MPLSSLSEGAIDPTKQRGIWVNGQHGYYTGNNLTTGLADDGLLDNFNIADASSVRNEDETGVSLRQNTGNGSNSNARIHGAAPLFQLQQLPLITLKWRLNNITDIRFVFLLTDTNTPLVSDDIGSNGIGLVFSTSRPDTNFQFISHDGATQTLFDSGIIADTNPHFLQINAIASNNVVLTLLDADFISQANVVLTTVNPVLPTSTTKLFLYLGIRNLVNANKEIDQYYGTILLRNS